MKKIILIVVGIVLVAILGRLGWEYVQVKDSGDSKVNNIQTSDSTPSNPTPPALPN